MHETEAMYTLMDHPPAHRFILPPTQQHPHLMASLYLDGPSEDSPLQYLSHACTAHLCTRRRMLGCMAFKISNDGPRLCDAWIRTTSLCPSMAPCIGVLL